MTDITAQNILDENNYTTSDISLVNTERLIDNAINYINLATGLSISNMSGAAGSKTVSVSANQAPIIKALATLMVRAYKDRGPNTSIGGLTVSALINDPQYALFNDMIKMGIQRLQPRTILRT